MKRARLAGLSFVAMLAALLLPAPTASAAEVPCGDPLFVKVTWHSSNPSGHGQFRVDTCFAGRGVNWFHGQTGMTSWMDHIRTGNNDVQFVDCNGTTIDYPRGTDRSFGDTPRCIAWINIRPF